MGEGRRSDSKDCLEQSNLESYWLTRTLDEIYRTATLTGQNRIKEIVNNKTLNCFYSERASLVQKTGS